MSSKWPDQQPVERVVGRRSETPVGTPPSAEARNALDSFAGRLTRAPKGVFRYACHEDMTRDRESWTVDAMVATTRALEELGRR